MNLRSIKSRLILVAALSMLLMALASVLTALQSSAEALTHANMNKLKAIKESKKEHLRDFYANMAALLRSKANDRATMETLWALDEAFQELASSNRVDLNAMREQLKAYYKKEYLGKINSEMPGAEPRAEADAYLPHSDSAVVAQFLYTADNENPVGEKYKLSMNKRFNDNYSGQHILFHSSYLALLKEFNLYDIFLVNADGDIVYTVAKENDFATNLNSDRYKNSGLARAYKEAIKLPKGGVAYDDFSPYEPSYNQPASFIAAPIYFGETDVEGALIFQLPIDKINTIMNFNGKYESVGLKQTGESYLIGSDAVMRSDSRFTHTLSDPLVRKLGTTVGVLKVNSDSAKAALSGKSGDGITENYRGVEVLSSYAPLEILGKKLAIIVEMERDEALESVATLRNLVIGVSAVIFIVMIVLVIFVIQKLIVSKLNTLETAAKDLAQGEGDLTQRGPGRQRQSEGADQQAGPNSTLRSASSSPKATRSTR